MLTVAAPGDHRKLGDNRVSSCEKAEQPKQTGEGGAGGKKKRISGTTEGNQAGQCFSWHWWDDRKKSNLKDMEVGTREQ